ncbi:pentatricopeptide repeat-containing protein [Dorcoceras hygrometricum]|uniref:Pentatricopeptide repeat-containing protein n=1 Tax=Dorcoceras hygrometricum TaxID=472368 RepID=A0A2Z7BYU1_9LAMI|nr:pentatricopeptide repeat-containing protein [Dorcoceras hygrometricum]
MRVERKAKGFTQPETISCYEVVAIWSVKSRAAIAHVLERFKHREVDQALLTLNSFSLNDLQPLLTLSFVNSVLDVDNANQFELTQYKSLCLNCFARLSWSAQLVSHSWSLSCSLFSELLFLQSGEPDWMSSAIGLSSAEPARTSPHRTSLDILN